MELTIEQTKALKQGQTVEVTVGEINCVLMRKDLYEQQEQLDYSPWTTEEMDLLAAEAAELLAGDGLDEPDES